MKKIILIASVFCFISLAMFAQENNTAKTDSIVFEKTAHDYGTIEYGSDGVYEFVFTNKGNSPLILNNVKAACGCTTPEWSREPIKPGKSHKIKVKYNTRIPGKFRKTIRVYSSAANSVVTLSITGTVNNKQ